MSDAMKDRVAVFPFSRQQDGADFIIGRNDGANFLALPAEAVEVLDDLASGCTLGEAQEHYEKRHGEVADVEGLVAVLEAEGFVQRESKSQEREGSALAEHAAPFEGATGLTPLKESRVIKPIGRKFHFSGFPEPLARAIFSRPVFLLGGLLFALAVAAVVAYPSIVPPPSALYFNEHLGTSVVWLAILLALQICLHELSHLIGARARGVPVRFGIGHRLWLLVLETDMSGVWTLPRRKRYLPILAGPFVDLVSLSGLILALAGEHRGLLEFSPVTMGVLRAMVIVYMYQLIWQCFFFVRTDFYYVVTTHFGCKNLMQDTQTFLRNLWRQWTGKGQIVDQSNIPAPEMKIIRNYSAVWLGGRLLALYLLIVIQIPIIFKYFALIGRSAYGFISGSPLGSVGIGVWLPAFMGLLTFGIGMFLWIRSLRASSRPAHLETGAAAESGEKGVGL